MIRVNFFVSVFVATAGLLFSTPSHSAYMTVGGSTNGNFIITGVVNFWTESYSTVVTTSPNYPTVFVDIPGQTDADQPNDSGTPVEIWAYDIYQSNYGVYFCNITMHGNVTNGFAEITSVLVSGGNTSVCTRINTSLSQTNNHLPWKFHTLTNPGNFRAIVKGITFHSPALFNCENVTSTTNIGGGYANFSTVPGVGGCHMTTEGNAATVTPSLDVVYP